MNILNIFRSKASIARKAENQNRQVELAKIMEAKVEINKWVANPTAYQYKRICGILDLPYCDGPILYIDELLFSNRYEYLIDELIKLRGYLKIG